METSTGLAATPLYAEHLALGGKMVPFAGWEMPIQYPAGIIAEHRATRAGAGLFDLSHMGELRVRGSGAGAALDALVSSDIGSLDVGRARYGLLTNGRGTIVDDVIVYRLAPDDLLVVVNAANIAKDRGHLTEHLGERGVRELSFTDESRETALIAIQGPHAVSLAARVAADPIDTLPLFGVRVARLAGAKAIVARTGYTGEDGFEIFVANADAVAVWRALLDAGAVPVGLGARDTLRLEARLSLYGNEIDETTNPIEAGLGWTCKLDKPFLGRDAIVAVKERGPERKLVGLVVNGGVARHGHPVADGSGQVIGRVTSGTFGPTVGKNIALAYVPVAHAAIGSALAVRIRERDVPATVVSTPFWRRS